MRLILAILLSFVAFFTIGRPIAGIICLILQITLIGWLPAAIWAVYALSQYQTDRKIEKALSARRNFETRQLRAPQNEGALACQTPELRQRDFARWSTGGGLFVLRFA